jgi:hypothetical protein
VVAVVAGMLVLTSCSGSEPSTPSAKPSASHHVHSASPPPSAPLRPGEKFVDLTMPEPYTPKAPTAPGTDDYRCFLLDPHLTHPAFVTGLDVLPGRQDLVHHVILFRVGPDAVAAAKARDANTKGEGWTCFGGPGVEASGPEGLQFPPWLGAWAPGAGESILAKDIGIPLKAGSRIVMQVHYNLLAGHGADTSSARLRLAPGTADLDPLDTMLLAAPVELPCRPGKTGRLCDRDAAVRDVAKRFGGQSGFAVAGLQLMCGGDPNHPKASQVQSCDRKIRTASTVRAVAGHMHRLGRSISITLNPGTPREHVLMDIRSWDFDNQRTQSLKKPVKMRPRDVLRVTCRHDQALRDLNPEVKGRPERYVVWGEGTTDEMCLGIVLVTQSKDK